MGVKWSHIVLDETQLIKISDAQYKIPECVTKDGNSYEVKRIPYTSRPGPPRRCDRGSQPPWHWKPVVVSGINKISDQLLKEVAEETGIIIRHHYVVLVVPETMTLSQRNRIHKMSNQILSETTLLVKTKIVVITGPVELF